MRRFLLIYILLLTGTFVKGQPTESQCYFAQKRGLIFSHRVILLKLDSQSYLMEYYSYGGGLFSGSPSTDTLHIDNGLLRTNLYNVKFDKDRMVVKSNDNGRRFKYKVLDKCDSLVNRTRNWSLRETIRYQIKDQVKAEEFWRETESILSSFCYPDFLDKIKELEKSYELRN
jgi:hypothetical protein